MNIFAVIKKAVNSNLNKPLNELILELNQPKRVVTKVIGIPYNATTDAQVLSTADAPVFSVNGTGRILEIFPVTQKDNDRNGTALLSVDGNVILNNRVYYAYGATTMGSYIVTDMPTDNEVTLEIFDTVKSFGFYFTPVVRADLSVFSNNSAGIYAPNGIPFKNSFEIRLTQSVATATEKTGLVIVYELYE